MKKVFWLGLILIASVFLAISAKPAFAGFGISPPYVRNDNLTRESHYEQKIILARGDPLEDSIAKITINVPGASDWISIDKGNSFVLPKGERAVPMIVRVNVPKDAVPKRYKGYIKVIVSPKQRERRGGVSIALGAQIDVNLNVTKNTIFNFKVRGVEILDLEEGYKWWIFNIPGKITMRIKIENLGNIPIAPSKVHLDIYNNQKNKLLESTETTKFKKKVPSFKTGVIFANLPTKLKPGSYWAKFKIYKGKNIVTQGELPMSILPRGSIAGFKGYSGFSGLMMRDKIIVVLLGVGVLLALGAIIFGILKLKKRKKK